jgi:hypothetical protein
MNYWILMFRPQTYEQVQEKGTIGVRGVHAKRFVRLQPGDRFIAYISRVRELDSHGEIVGEPYVDIEPLFPEWTYYSQRCAVKFESMGAHVDAKELLWGLSIFGEDMKTSPANMLLCKGGFMQITEEDYKWVRSVLDGTWTRPLPE